MDKNKSEHQFFAELLSDTEKQFKQSPVYQKQLKQGKNWNYAVCATPIQRERGILFGINWGGDDNQPQIQIPSGEDIVDYTFVKQNRNNLEKVGLNFTEINFNYTNLCFFRTPKANLLMEDDFRLSLPLFERYVRYINPPWLLSIGEKNIKILNRFKLLREIDPHYDHHRKFKGHSALLWNWNVFSAPHSQAKMTNKARQTIWDKLVVLMNKL